MCNCGWAAFEIGYMMAISLGLMKKKEAAVWIDGT